MIRSRCEMVMTCRPVLRFLVPILLLSASLVFYPVTLRAQALSQLQAPRCLDELGPLKEPLPQEKTRPPTPLETSDSQIREINDLNPEVRVITIKYKGADPRLRYTAIAGVGTPIYQGGDLGELAKQVKAQGTSRADTLYVAASGFSADKIKALETSLRIQLAQIDGAPELRVLNASNVPALLFSRSAKLEHISTPELVTTGERKGWFRSVAAFTFAGGKALRRATVTIFARTRELAQEFWDVLNTASSLSKPGHEQSIAAIVSTVRAEVKRKHPGLTDDELAAEFTDQFGKNYLVLLTFESEDVGG
jgi:hypothetical protein